MFKKSKNKASFPPNKSTHDIEPRNHELFHVNHANSEGLKNSPGIYMQNLLNTEARRKMEIISLRNKNLLVQTSVISEFLCVL